MSISAGVSGAARPVETRGGYRQFRATPMCGALGAKIEGVDLSKPIDEALAGELRQVLLDHLVIVFPEQDLSPAQQIAFTSVYGKVERHPLYRSNVLQDYPDILVLEHKEGQWINGRNDIWHTDLTFREDPPMAGVLYCKDVREGHGDTMFANMYTAHDSLSPGLKRMLDGMKAEHSAALLRERNNKNSYNVPIGDIAPPVIHPVIRTHPDSGRKSLFVNPSFITNFVGMTREESLPLLNYLYGVASQPERVYRHRWRVGDVVMWDQRCTMHYVVIDYGPDMHRLMHRTTASGNRPF
jgi:taurine dioxygenase